MYKHAQIAIIKFFSPFCLLKATHSSVHSVKGLNLLAGQKMEIKHEL